MNDTDIEEFVQLMLEDETFEELIERFDVTPFEAFMCIFNNGLIDPESLEELMRQEGISESYE